MRRGIIILSGIFLLLAFIAPIKKDHSFQQLHALEGTWIMKTKKGYIGESWEKVSDDHMQSKGFYVKGNDTTISEKVALKNTATGIFYISTVENQNNKQPVAFKLTSSANNIFIFENPSHDFPKRIVYNLVSKDSLHAYIDGGENQPGRQDFYYTKVK